MCLHAVHLFLSLLAAYFVSGRSEAKRKKGLLSPIQRAPVPSKAVYCDIAVITCSLCPLELVLESCL